MNEDKKLEKEDLNVEKALDNIFDEDTNKQNEEDLSKTSLNINSVNNEDFDYSKMQDEIVINTPDSENKEETSSDENIDIKEEDNGKALNFISNNFDDKTENTSLDEPFDEGNKSDLSDIVNANLDPANGENITSSYESYNTPVETESNTPKKNNKMLYLILGAIFVAILIVVLCVLSINCEKKTSCSYTVNDTNYKITDTYEIKYKKNKILYVNGKYAYEAKTKDFESQINIIRQEKIPVMVNSNAMKGFTYMLDEGNDNFSITSSLDFTSFDYNEISKIDQKANPISYFEIDSTLTYEKLKNILEKQGYTCKKA